MDIKQLTALVTVAQFGSVTRAAQVLHLVQPAVSRQIRSLETELGVALFERTRTGMRPTGAGAIVVERAQRALREIERARAEVRPPGSDVAGIVNVGLLGTTLELLAHPLVEAVTRRYPGVDLRLSTAYSGHLQDWLDSGDLDLSLVYNCESTPTVRVTPLLQDELWVVGPPDAALHLDQPVDVSQALRHPFVMPVPGHGLRVLLDEAAAAAGVEPNVVVQTDSMMLQKMLVSAGEGWTALPAPGVIADVLAGRLSAAPLREPCVSRSVALALPRVSRTPAAVEVVAGQLLRLVRDAVRTGAWPAATLATTPAANPEATPEHENLAASAGDGE